MKINFTEIAWQDYVYWQGQDKKTIKRINQLIQDIDCNHNEGIFIMQFKNYLDGKTHI